MLWTLQARLRKARNGSIGKESSSLTEGSLKGGPLEGEPFIFVTGDTSYGSCCVDEVSAQHLKADAIVHYGERTGYR